MKQRLAVAEFPGLSPGDSRLLRAGRARSRCCCAAKTIPLQRPPAWSSERLTPTAASCKSHHPCSARPLGAWAGALWSPFLFDGAPGLGDAGPPTAADGRLCHLPAHPSAVRLHKLNTAAFSQHSREPRLVKCRKKQAERGLRITGIFIHSLVRFSSGAA